MVNAVEKTLLRKPRDLLKRIYQLEEEKNKLQSHSSSLYSERTAVISRPQVRRMD